MSFKIEMITTRMEIAEVEALGKTIWTQHYTPIIGEDQVRYMLNKFQSIDAITNQLNEGYRYYLIQNNNISIGYISVQKREDSLFLSKFYILDTERGKGFGKKAMQYLISLGQELDCESISLTVNKYNKNSIEAYKSFGFTISEAVVFDIGEGYVMDDYRMEKSLNLL